MRADSRTEQYIAYGNMGCIGKSIHSNARELSSPYIKKERIEEIVEYDSSLPFKQGEKRVNNFVRKKSRKRLRFSKFLRNFAASTIYEGVWLIRNVPH